MSASTVSITATPATTRRRPVLSGEKRSGAELLTGEGTTAVSGGLSGRDLSHSIRGEEVLERSRDAVHIKNAFPSNATAAMPSRRPTRKASLKPEKPRWQTVMSIFTKNFLLVLTLLGLIHLIRKLAIPSGNNMGNHHPSSSVSSVVEFEGRIAEMEGFLKTTTKMMQVQVEIVDRKIESEIGGVRRDMSKEIEEKGVGLGNELKRIDERTTRLERGLSELGAKEWVAKDEFGRFFEEFTKKKGGEDGDVNLDELRALARKIVGIELEKHAADGLGMVDYALGSGGGRVTKYSEAFVGKGNSWFLFNGKNAVDEAAKKMLTPSFGEPGECFPLKGSSGFVVVRLRTAIIPEAVTLEHVAKSVAYDRTSAPKDCRVSGWLQGNSDIDEEKMLLLTEFTYDLDKSNAQTFSTVSESSSSSSSNLVDTIRFDFASNHGSSSFTCIYRLRVHGHEPSSSLYDGHPGIL
ncbi:SUN domain-containing protein 2-like [Impatiens glandulifera]|uniref:SUN domain-containing protein 2-like n=1 Tax=Impatiens glandulifera TaxID=253017 RepID=UPI001FB0EBBF|nr:SUN domain-containing protein 2-like [Impatiens glandulifera]XP_047314787.1 SUN domain-containing protein 2-like [Impatiens glandulifera]